jgi:hypothetical protein
MQVPCCRLPAARHRKDVPFGFPVFWNIEKK